MNVTVQKIIYWLALIVVTSCTDGNSWEVGTRVPSLKAHLVYFPHTDIELSGSFTTEKNYQLLAYNTSWKFVNPSSDWLTISPMEGIGDATISFVARENPTSDNTRTAVLYLKSLDSDYTFSHYLTVNQSKANAELIPNMQSVEFTRESQTKTIFVSANTDWMPSCSSEWLHLRKISNGSLEVTVDDNNTTTRRPATIKLTGSTMALIDVVQQGYEFGELITELSFEPVASSQMVNVSTDGPWTAISDQGWIHVSPSLGSGNSSLSISVEKNEKETFRTGIVAITVGETTKNIFIQQKGIYIDIIDSSSSEISYKGGTRSVSFVSSEDWIVENKNSWVTVDRTYGNSGSNTINLTFAANPLDTKRNDTTYVRTQGTPIGSLRIISSQSAAPQPSKWDGVSVSKLWINKPSGRTYHISTAADLAGLSSCYYGSHTTYNKFSGDTIVLDNDIDLCGYEWIPIGILTSSNTFYSFNGTFDGNGHTVKGLKVSKLRGSKSIQYAGLFGFNDELTIKNLNVEGEIIIETSTLESGGRAYIGGIGGITGGKFLNCNSAVHTTVKTNTEGIRIYCGGIIGSWSWDSSDDKRICNKCFSSGAINLTLSDIDEAHVGGVIGYLEGSGFEGNELASSANIIVDNGRNTSVGGILGFAWGDTVNNALFTGNITVLNQHYGNIGGIVGSAIGASSIKNSLAISSLESENGIAYISPIVGSCTSDISILSCYYKGGMPNHNGYGVPISDSELKSGKAINGFNTNIWTFAADSYPYLNFLSSQNK